MKKMEKTSTKIIQGRPDFTIKNFGVTRAKRHPKYVFGSVFGCLVHEIRYVEFRWYDVIAANALQWRDSPKISATTKCGIVFFINNYNSRAKANVCEIPKADSVYCKACQNNGKNFPKNKEWEVSKQEAKSRLGCNDIIRI